MKASKRAAEADQTGLRSIALEDGSGGENQGGALLSRDPTVLLNAKHSDSHVRVSASIHDLSPDIAGTASEAGHSPLPRPTLHLMGKD